MDRNLGLILIRLRAIKIECVKKKKKNPRRFVATITNKQQRNSFLVFDDEDQERPLLAIGAITITDMQRVGDGLVSNILPY